MFPILAKIGPVTLHTYGLMVGLGVVMGTLVLTRLAKRAGMDPDRVFNLTLWVVFFGLIGARLAHVALEPGPYLARPWRILFIWQGGLAFYGGLVLAVGAGWWLAQRRGLPILPLMDVAGPALALGQAFGRLGCFSSDDSYGLPFNGPWAVTFTNPHSLAPQGVPLHPTQLYAAGALFIIFAVLRRLWPRRRFDGQVFFLYGIMHGTSRFIIEQFRGDYRGEPIFGLIAPTGLFALGLALVSVFALAYLWRGRTRRGAAPNPV